MKRLFYILALSGLVSCENDTAYSDYETSPVKSVECNPMFMPLAVSEGAVVTLTADTAANTYNFIKIDQNAAITSKSITFSWSISGGNGMNFPGTNEEPNQLESKQQATPQQNNVEVDISEGQLRKNSNDEFFLEFYSSNDFGREYYAVVKFDKDCNVLFQIDSTVNAMGGNQQGGTGGQNQSVNKLPVAGTPLDNGGYAMILQTPTMGMMQSSSYDLTLRYINASGEIEKTSDLSFSENVSISSVNSINNNIAVFYKNSDGDSFVKVFTLDGAEVSSSTVSSTLSSLNFLNCGEYGYISGYNSETQKFVVAQVNSNGEIEFQRQADTVAVFVNITELDGQMCFSGFSQPSNPSLSTIEAYMNYISDFNGILVITDSEGGFNTITADYGCGIIIYAAFNSTDGGYTVFLTRVTPLDLLAQQNSSYGTRIYVYKTDDIKNLQIN